MSIIFWTKNSEVLTDIQNEIEFSFYPRRVTQSLHSGRTIDFERPLIMGPELFDSAWPALS